LFRHDKWNIGIVHEPIDVFLEPATRPNVSWGPPLESDRYLSDPFLVTKNKKAYVFCEEYDYKSMKGRIISFELENEKFTSKAKVAIEMPFHISYPFCFEHEGNVYCIPETQQIRQITLYRAEEFPCKWERVATLIDNFAGVDGTVFQHNGSWWLTSSLGGRYSSLRLMVWHSSKLLGPWKPHTQNPVKTDSSSTRPAGTPFTHAGSLYRPAQDCSKRYGGRVVLNRVVLLTPTEFKEEKAAVIEPFDALYPDGIHTISGGGNITLIDGNRRVFSENTVLKEYPILAREACVSLLSRLRL
jgi:hypothetical protein